MQTYEQVSVILDELPLPNTEEERIIFRAAWLDALKKGGWTEEDYDAAIEERMDREVNNTWSEDRLKAERAIGELVRKSQHARCQEKTLWNSDRVSAMEYCIRAQCYEAAITIIQESYRNSIAPSDLVPVYVEQVGSHSYIGARPCACAFMDERYHCQHPAVEAMNWLEHNAAGMTVFIWLPQYDRFEKVWWFRKDNEGMLRDAILAFKERTRHLWDGR